MQLSRTQKKNAARRAQDKANTVGVFCNGVVEHPLPRATPMEMLTKYGIENAKPGSTMSVPCKFCHKCRDTMVTFADRLHYLYRPDGTYLTLHNVVYATRGEDEKLDVYRGTFYGRVFEVESEDDNTWIITVKLQTTFASLPVPKSYQLTDDDLRLICIDDGLRVVRFALHDGIEVHYNAIIGIRCNGNCKEPCEYHVKREPTLLETIEVPFAERVHQLYKVGNTYVTVHNVVFCILNKKTKAYTMYTGSFHGKVHKMEDVLDGGIEVTIWLRNAHAVEPIPDATAAKLPPTYSRVIVLDDGVTRVVRFLLHKSVTHDNLKIGAVCKKWCKEECEFHMLRAPIELK